MDKGYIVRAFELMAHEIETKKKNALWSLRYLNFIKLSFINYAHKTK